MNQTFPDGETIDLRICVDCLADLTKLPPWTLDRATFRRSQLSGYLLEMFNKKYGRLDHDELFICMYCYNNRFLPSLTQEVS